MIYGILVIICAALLAICVVVISNWYWPIDTTIGVRPSGQPLTQAGPDIRVLTWNIGYGALGKEADLILDGGKSIRALSKPRIVAATHAIAHQLSENDLDTICMQEVAQPSVLTRNTNVLGMLDAAQPNWKRYFWEDFKTVLLPRMLHISHGMATYCTKSSDDCRVVELPFGQTLILGFLKKRYAGLLTRLPIEGTGKAWVIINIHLPIYKTTASDRAAFLGHLFDVASREYAQGNYVVIAGDWNMRLCPTAFDHDGDPASEADTTDLPLATLPAGWQIKADSATPTVRFLNAPFEKGKTFTAVFDGYAVSPNVVTESVKTTDLGFSHADHQPVIGRFSCG